MRNVIGAVHAVVLAVFVLVLGTGLLTFWSVLLWLALCAGVDQIATWGLWASGNRKGPNPNEGWF